MALQKNILLKFMSLWPPYLGSGIRIKKITPDFTEIDVEMKLRFWNQNYVGTHFGGSLYSMTDPFFMLMLIENLGRDYIVWDKAATIQFKKPGKGKVFAQFRLTQEQLNYIRQETTLKPKLEHLFKVSVVDDKGIVIAEVEKLLYIRKKEQPSNKFLES